jgi:hypothetical protein
MEVNIYGMIFDNKLRNHEIVVCGQCHFGGDLWCKGAATYSTDTTNTPTDKSTDSTNSCSNNVAAEYSYNKDNYNDNDNNYDNDNYNDNDKFMFTTK